MSVSILVDYNNIVKNNNLLLLENRIASPPQTEFSIGLVIVIKKEQYETLKSIPKGYKRIKYMNSIPFVSSISGYEYFTYDKNKKICEVFDIKDKILPRVIESILFSLPNDITVFVNISLDDKQLDRKISVCITSGFYDPYISKVCPLGFTFPENRLYMIRKNDIIGNESINSVKNDVKYVLKQFRIYKLSNYNYCILKAKLSKKAIKYLKSASKIGSTINANGVITQKEIAGRLVVGKVRNDLVYELDVDRTSIMYGEEEQVDLISGLYNFHSHPQEAYDRHNQTIGWPSAQDYVVFFESSLIYDTLIHIVASVEGFYVLSLSKFWFNNKNVSDIQKQVKKFILDNYNKCSQKDNTIDWYVSTINGITYEGFQLFQVQYVSWNDADTIFTFSYKKNGVNCIARQSTLDIIKK